MTALRITEQKNGELKAHLFPGDGREAIAFVLCGRHESNGVNLLTVHQVHLLSYDKCERSENFVKWETDDVSYLFDLADKNNFAIIKFHSHPTGYKDFSALDDKSDRSIFETIHSWIDDGKVHGSVIMLPSGELFGRIIHADLSFTQIDKISVIGDSIVTWHCDSNHSGMFNEFEIRNRQAFGDETVEILQSMKVAVIGCSGTGSPTIEQLYRLGIGELVIIDPKVVELKNLNRIIGSTKKSAENKTLKVDTISEHIDNVGLGTKVKTYPCNIYDSIGAINEIATCDFIVGCVDSAEGRHILSLISTFYLVPYIDLGVKLKADGNGNIASIDGAINYLQPGKSSLLTRGVYTLKELEAESMKRVSPSKYSELRESGYIINLELESPAVISVNMFISSLGVNELLARVHQTTYRNEPNSRFATTSVNLCEWDIITIGEAKTDLYLEKYVGMGDINPILNLVELSKFDHEKAA